MSPVDMVIFLSAVAVVVTSAAAVKRRRHPPKRGGCGSCSSCAWHSSCTQGQGGRFRLSPIHTGSKARRNAQCLLRFSSMGLLGVDGFLIRVEADLSQGLPGFDVVGLPGAAVRESGTGCALPEKLRLRLSGQPHHRQPGPGRCAQGGVGLRSPSAAGPAEGQRPAGRGAGGQRFSGRAVPVRRYPAGAGGTADGHCRQGRRYPPGVHPRDNAAEGAVVEGSRSTRVKRCRRFWTIWRAGSRCRRHSPPGRRRPRSAPRILPTS